MSNDRIKEQAREAKKARSQNARTRSRLQGKTRADSEKGPRRFPMPGGRPKTAGN